MSGNGSSPAQTRTRPDSPRAPRVLIIRQGHVHLDPRVRRQMESLLSSGFEIDVLCRRRRGSPDRESDGRVTIRRLLDTDRRGGPVRYVLQYAHFMALAFGWATVQHVRRRYDLVQVHSLPDSLVFAALLPRLLGVPVLLDLQETMPEFFATKFGLQMRHPLARVIGWVEQASIHFASHVLTCTEQMRQAFVGRGAPEAKITVVLNSANEEEFDPARWQAIGPRADDDFVLVCHGTVEERYGHDTVVQAMGLLKNEIPELRLKVYGDGSYLPVVQQLVRELAIEDRVWFSNDFVPLPQLVEGIASADVGVVAMRRDVFRDLTHCNKMFDFITMRLPAIVSRTRSVEAYFGDDCFQLFTAGDPEDLARAIRELYARPERRAELVRRAAATNEPYRWPRQRLRYLAAVRSLLGPWGATLAGPSEQEAG